MVVLEGGWLSGDGGFWERGGVEMMGLGLV